MKNIDPQASQAGFTLIEALVAIVILIFGLVAVTNLFVVAASSNTVGNHGTASATAASETLEDLKAEPFRSALLAPGGSLAANVPNYFREDDISGVGIIRSRWQVTQVDGQTLFIRVRSESTSPLAGRRARAEFTTFRSCTAVAAGCPTP